MEFLVCKRRFSVERDHTTSQNNNAFQPSCWLDLGLNSRYHFYPTGTAKLNSPLLPKLNICKHPIPSPTKKKETREWQNSAYCYYYLYLSSSPLLSLVLNIKNNPFSTLKPLINATSFPSEKENLLGLFESWNSSSNCCDWDMVNCNSHFGSRNVIALDMGYVFGNLHSIVLTSTILTPLFHIRSLARLGLCFNQIQGELPGDRIANLTNLIDLDLSYNDFNGPIPSQLFNLSYLQYLDVSYNSFSGNIPNEIGNKTELQELSLQHNNFFGKIPSSILNLKRLETLDLSYNSLSMEIPIDIGNLSNIIILNFRNNELTGTIPSSIWKLPKLEKLELENNLFIGEIPSWLFNITGLKSLYLGGNHLIWNTKAKIVPKFTLLFDLSMKSCGLARRIPFWISMLKYLSLFFGLEWQPVRRNAPTMAC